MATERVSTTRVSWGGAVASSLAIALLWGLTATGLHAADGNNTPASTEPPSAKVPAKTEFECRWADSPITIDGKGDEPAWQQAELIDNFYLPWLGAQARPAKTATRARVLWDRNYFYWIAEMDDGDLYADITEHDGKCWFNDVFELFFKPSTEKGGYYEFQVNAAGAVMDCFMPRRGAGGFERFGKDGEFHIETKVALRGTLNKWQDKDTGWTVEGRIPWSDFLRTGGRPDFDEAWLFTLCRYDYSVDFEGPELSTCAPLTQANFHQYEQYAKLVFRKPSVAALSRTVLRDYAPLRTSRVIGSPEPPDPYRVVRAYPDLKINFPIAVAHEPGSQRIWFIDQPQSYGHSSLNWFRDAADVNTYEPLWLPTKPERTAYGITFHPDYLKNGYVYIGSAGAFNADQKTKSMRISRFTMERTADTLRFDPASELVIIEWESDGHNGGDVAFGLDGLMYVTTGDGTSDSDTNLRGQDMVHLTSKVLRIDVDHPDPGRAYSVPKDNPFLHIKDARPETWAFGFRNPWRITVDRERGHIWVGNNGQDLWEQAYLVERGANYGWSVMEGSHPFYLDRQQGPAPISKPTLEHPHSEARSLTGGVVYYGQKYPELRGAYIYGDHSTGKVWGAKHDGKQVTWHKELVDTTLQISGFGTDSNGELLINDHRGDKQGGFYRLELNPPQTAAAPFPRKLSESGLFSAVAGHVVQPGVVPYSVISSLWSDGAWKERFIAIPHRDGENRVIDINGSRGWGFPDETVLIKSFALEMEAGNPASRKWVETRFMTRQQGEWAGYSYIWNDEQTDATLVEAPGLDREFVIRVPKSAEHPDGLRKQTWRYPSRTECMVCHSRAAKFVLGPQTLQMNKDHDYGGGHVENQLMMLERLGLLKINNVHADLLAEFKADAQKRGLKDAALNEYVRQQTASRDQREPVRESHLFGKLPHDRPKLVDPYDSTQDLNARARSYLHTNCSICHVDAGGGNAKLELEFTTAIDKMNVFSAVPMHHKFDLPEARIVSPGHPERSVLLHRVSRRGQGQMPQLATSVIDQQAVEMLREWIAKLPPETGTPPAAK